MHKNILISGGSGLVGTRLTELLMQKGYQISHLSRNSQPGPTRKYQWSVANGTIDDRAVEVAETVIHLAGAGIADKRWSKNRKKVILESRTKSIDLIFQALTEKPHGVKTFITASAIGYYGYAEDDRIFTEKSNPGNDYLADVVKQWEYCADKISTLGIRVVKIRIGILLSEKGGALAEMTKPVKWGVGSPLGPGDQHISWIHIDDVCKIFIEAVEDDSMQGVYNAVSPHPTTNKELTTTIAKILNKPIWLPNVPSFVLKLMLGEMSDLVLKGSKVSADKIQKTGFEFLYTDLEKALSDLLVKKVKS